MSSNKTHRLTKYTRRYARYTEIRSFTGHEHYADLKIINMNG